MDIKKTLLPAEKLKPLYEDALRLKFGKMFTDYMFTMNYEEGKGWYGA